MGRKSSITQLPPEIKQQVDRLLGDGRATIEEIVAQLTAMGTTVSKSAVGRYKKTFDAEGENIRQAQAMAGVWAEKLGADPEGKIGRGAIQILNTVAFQSAMRAHEEGDFDAKDVNLLARALKDLESASTLSTRREMQIRDNERKLAAEKLNKLEKTGTLDPKTLQRVREEIYGLA